VQRHVDASSSHELASIEHEQIQRIMWAWGVSEDQVGCAC